MNDEHIRELVQQPHGREIVHRVVFEIFIERRSDRQGPVGTEEHGVTIRVGAGHGLSSDIAAGARPVLDDDGLPEAFRQSFRYGTSEHVRGAPGSKPYKQPDRAVRIILRGHA